MGMWPRVDVELIADYAALSPWGKKTFLRIRTDVPLDEKTAQEITGVMNSQLDSGDFGPVLDILEKTRAVSAELATGNPETQRTWATIRAALLPAPKSR
jgi:hypothetical protein